MFLNQWEFDFCLGGLFLYREPPLRVFSVIELYLFMDVNFNVQLTINLLYLLSIDQLGIGKSRRRITCPH